MFDVDAFVAACVDARNETDPVAAVREVVRHAVRDPEALAAAFPIPVGVDDDDSLLRSAELFIAQGPFPRGFETGIHEHTVAAVIGVWAGYEDNLLYRRIAGGLEHTGTERVASGEVLCLAPDAIHDVHAPTTRWTAAIHVYLGDITTLDRHAWPSLEAEPVPLDGAEMEARWVEAAIATGLARSD